MKINGNGKRVMCAGVDTKDWPFVKLKEKIGHTVPVNGFFFSKGKYGEQVVVAGEGELINMPGRAAEEFEELFLYNQEYKKALLDGKISLTNICEVETNQGKTVGYDIDMEE